MHKGKRFLRHTTPHSMASFTGRFRKRVVLANVPLFRLFVPGDHANVRSFRFFVPGENPNVPSFRFSFRGNIRQNHPFGFLRIFWGHVETFFISDTPAWELQRSDLSPCRLLHRLTIHTDEVLYVVFSPDGTRQCRSMQLPYLSFA